MFKLFRQQVAGNFIETMTLAGISSSVGDFAMWDIASSSWTNSGGFVEGSFAFIGNGSIFRWPRGTPLRRHFSLRKVARGA